MLLAQDVGQSLFVSAKLEGLAANSAASGDLRLIARRVFLDKLRMPGLAGRGTIDAKLHLNAGRVESATWQASARELEMNGEQGVRFDHIALSGAIERNAHDVLLSFNDLQFTRGARLERAPQLSARVVFEPRSLRIARTTVQGERVPFMAAEFIAGLLAPQLADGMPALPGGWAPTAGELRALRSLHFDSGARRESRDAWTFSADLAGTEITRAADNARLADIAAKLRLDAQGLTVVFDPATCRCAAHESCHGAAQHQRRRHAGFRERHAGATLAIRGVRAGEWGFVPASERRVGYADRHARGRWPSSSRISTVPWSRTHGRSSTVALSRRHCWRASSAETWSRVRSSCCRNATRRE